MPDGQPFPAAAEKPSAGRLRPGQSGMKTGEMIPAGENRRRPPEFPADFFPEFSPPAPGGDEKQADSIGFFVCE